MMRKQNFVISPEPDSFCAAKKIISDWASVHTQERLWRRDFCDEAKLRRADL